jgi:hypothetical protein
LALAACDRLIFVFVVCLHVVIIVVKDAEAEDLWWFRGTHVTSDAQISLDHAKRESMVLRARLTIILQKLNSFV